MYGPIGLLQLGHLSGQLFRLGRQFSAIGKIQDTANPRCLMSDRKIHDGTKYNPKN